MPATPFTGSPHQYTGVGLNNVGSYQVSGMPYASGSIDCTGSYATIEFPYVTRWIQVINHDNTNELKVAFSVAGLTGDNHFKVHSAHNANKEGGYLPRLEVKVSKLYISGSDDCDVIAGLTSIPASIIPNSWSGSAGVG